MKLLHRIMISALLPAVINATADTWTSKTGTTMEADFVKEKYGTVYLKGADGSVKQIKTSNLSKGDQERIARLTDPFAAKKTAIAAVPKASDAMYELFGDELRNSSEKKVSVDALADKTIGIYFSAHWCPPCRTFTPELVKFHKEMTRKGKSFEIVFVSSDRDRNAMYSYMKEMDMAWLALPFGDDRKSILSRKFQVRGIPKLVIIDTEGNLITENGRGDVSRLGSRAFDQWE